MSEQRLTPTSSLRGGARPPPCPLPRPGPTVPRARQLTCQRQDLGLVQQQRTPVARGARGALRPGAQLLRAPVHGVHLLVVKIQTRAGAEVAHARHGQRVADVVLQESHKGVHGGRGAGPAARRWGPRGARAAQPGRAGVAPRAGGPPTVIVPESSALPIGCSGLGAEKRGRGKGGGGLTRGFGSALPLAKSDPSNHSRSAFRVGSGKGRD